MSVISSITFKNKHPHRFECKTKVPKPLVTIVEILGGVEIRVFDKEHFLEYTGYFFPLQQKMNHVVIVSDNMVRVDFEDNNND